MILIFILVHKICSKCKEFNSQVQDKVGGRGPGSRGVIFLGDQGRDQMDQMAVLRFTFHSSVECFQLSMFLECCLLNVPVDIQSVHHAFILKALLVATVPSHRFGCREV